MSNYTEITGYIDRYSAKITETSTDIHSMKAQLQALEDFSGTELAKLIKEALSIKNDNKGILRSKDIVYKIREEIEYQPYEWTYTIGEELIRIYEDEMEDYTFLDSTEVEEFNYDGRDERGRFLDNYVYGYTLTIKGDNRSYIYRNVFDIEHDMEELQKAIKKAEEELNSLIERYNSFKAIQKKYKEINLRNYDYKKYSKYSYYDLLPILKEDFAYAKEVHFDWGCNENVFSAIYTVCKENNIPLYKGYSFQMI